MHLLKHLKSKVLSVCTIAGLDDGNASARPLRPVNSMLMANSVKLMRLPVQEPVLVTPLFTSVVAVVCRLCCSMLYPTCDSSQHLQQSHHHAVFKQSE